MTRPRKHIPLIELLASALADKLPYLERQWHREHGTTAREIVRMFTPDHVCLHCWDGDDTWDNLTMTRRGSALKAKDAADTKRAAKVKRIEEKEKRWRKFMRKASAPSRPLQKRRWPSRPFPRRKKERT